MEKAFRIFFYIWSSFWGLINIAQVASQYIIYDQIYDRNNDAELGLWFINTMSYILGVFLGVLLLIKMIYIPRDLSNKKPVKNINIYVILASFYYFFISLVNLASRVLLMPEDFPRESIFQVTWIFPSFMVFVFHILYFQNIREYNTSLKENN